MSGERDGAEEGKRARAPPALPPSVRLASTATGSTAPVSAAERLQRINEILSSASKRTAREHPKGADDAGSEPQKSNVPLKVPPKAPPVRGMSPMLTRRIGEARSHAPLALALFRQGSAEPETLNAKSVTHSSATDNGSTSIGAAGSVMPSIDALHLLPPPHLVFDSPHAVFPPPSEPIPIGALDPMTLAEVTRRGGAEEARLEEERAPLSRDPPPYDSPPSSFPPAVSEEANPRSSFLPPIEASLRQAMSDSSIAPEHLSATDNGATDKGATDLLPPAPYPAVDASHLPPPLVAAQVATRAPARDSPPSAFPRHVSPADNVRTAPPLPEQRLGDPTDLPTEHQTQRMPPPHPPVEESPPSSFLPLPVKDPPYSSFLPLPVKDSPYSSFLSPSSVESGVLIRSSASPHHPWDPEPTDSPHSAFLPPPPPVEACVSSESAADLRTVAPFTQQQAPPPPSVPDPPPSYFPPSSHDPRTAPSTQRGASPMLPPPLKESPHSSFLPPPPSSGASMHPHSQQQQQLPSMERPAPYAQQHMPLMPPPIAPTVPIVPPGPIPPPSSYVSKAPSSPPEPIEAAYSSGGIHNRARPRGAVSRINPEQLPRPPRPAAEETYVTSSAQRRVPPRSCDAYEAVDTGNASPRLLRSACCAPPASSELLAKQCTGLALAYTCCPFAAPENTESPVPLVDYSESSAGDASAGRKSLPIRCSRCQGYLCVSSTWASGGGKWGCHLCGMANDTPDWYYCSLDGAGLRRDREERPELHRGAVDYLVAETGEEPLSLRCLVLAVDVSAAAVCSGLSATAFALAETLVHALAEQEGAGGAARVGVVTFSSALHLYSCGAGGGVRMHVCGGGEPVAAVPLDRWLHPLSDQGLERLRALLKALPALHPRGEGAVDGAEGATCVTELLRCVGGALAGVGARLIVLTSSLPLPLTAIAAADVPPKRAAKALPHAPIALASLVCCPEEKTLLDAYQGLSDTLRASRVCVSVVLNDIVSECRGLAYPVVNPMGFAGSGKANGAAVFASLTSDTGGDLFVVNGFMSTAGQRELLCRQVLKMVEYAVASDVSIKVRCSQGVRFSEYLGKGVASAVDGEVLEVCGLGARDCFAFTLRHEGAALREDDKLCVQVALLYVDREGRRRVRVLNSCLYATTVAKTVYQHIDLDCLAAVLVKQTVLKTFACPVKDLSAGPLKSLYDRLLTLLVRYRTHCAAHMPRGQLILPDAIKALPLFVLGIMKHPALRENGVSIETGLVDVQERALELHMLLHKDVGCTINAVYPRVFRAYPLHPEDLERMRSFPSSSQYVENDNAYVIDDGSSLWLYKGKYCDKERIEHWFSSTDRRCPELRGDTRDGDMIRQLVAKIRDAAFYQQGLKAVLSDDRSSDVVVTKNYNDMCLRLVEDSVFGESSYEDFLVKLHSKIQNSA